MLRKLAPTVVAAIAFLSLAQSASADCGAVTPVASASVADAVSFTPALVNECRAAKGVAPPKARPALARIARAYSGQMISGRFFAHVSPTGEHVVARVQQGMSLRNRTGWAVGENLA